MTKLINVRQIDECLNGTIPPISRRVLVDGIPDIDVMSMDIRENYFTGSIISHDHIFIINDWIITHSDDNLFLLKIMVRILRGEHLRKFMIANPQLAVHLHQYEGSSFLYTTSMCGDGYRDLIICNEWTVIEDDEDGGSLCKCLLSISLLSILSLCAALTL